MSTYWLKVLEYAHTLSIILCVISMSFIIISLVSMQIDYECKVDVHHVEPDEYKFPKILIIILYSSLSAFILSLLGIIFFHN